MSDSVSQPQQNTQSTHAESIHVIVRNRRKILFNGDVKAITSRNDSGLFDILPEHANFISVIKEKIILHQSDGEKYEIELANGIVKVKDSAVHCYIDLIAPEMEKKN